MTQPTFHLNASAQQYMDEYLNSVDQVMQRAGASGSERRNILDDLRTQILEMLAGRTQGTVTLEDVQAVLAELDPPEAYALETVSTQPPPTQPRLSRLAVVGVIWAPFIFILAFMCFPHVVAVKVEPNAVPPGPAWWQYLLMLTVLPLGLTAPFGTTILGFIAIAQIRRLRGRLYGLGLALADAMFGPMLLLYAISYAAVYAAFEVIWYFTEGTGDVGINLSVTGSLALGVTAIAGFVIIRRVWRAISKPLESKQPPSTASAVE